ncbi:3-hydroxyacyl-CoA dehydrogenase family protein [Umboniibacter marinipuniceus]|uniref:Enoyl-CoA hydratase/3-hydroxyacyl-CoA dehydrogenase n=1 Tax=Umboniibacter marinipuniceus TaxID=569599 RepID=A0A3M0ADE9_9GAMM|nr:3-hydroxyacyl-CoA dehydrogenase family protein [Umboniibacter marinipuniceus]RMA82537.1 enoyl-CoA hydratase/3-hydroxyacyl-CoA dehydrogenase [Umboniibacter marinipuniceus]
MNTFSKVCVLGAGDMGHGIAEVALLAGYEVNLRDINDTAVNRGAQRILDSFDIFERKGKISAEQKAAMVAKLHCFTELEPAVSDAELIIEAVPEIFTLKRDTFLAIEAAAAPKAIIASNTSTMSISEIGATCANQTRIAGLHYFNPAVLMPTVEVIKAKHTSEETMIKLVDFCERCRKQPVRVEKDVPGFIVNRVQAPAGILLNAWLDSGEADPETVDAMVRSATGAPMGPFETIDYTGVDVNVHCSNYYAETIHPDFAAGTTMQQLMNAGKLGKKSGEGLFSWANGRPAINLSQRSDEIDIADLFLVNANEAVRIAALGVAKHDDIDRALQGATGNPNPLFAQLRAMNHSDVVERLTLLASRYNKAAFTPCKALSEAQY